MRRGRRDATDNGRHNTRSRNQGNKPRHTFSFDRNSDCRCSCRPPTTLTPISCVSITILAVPLSISVPLGSHTHTQTHTHTHTRSQREDSTRNCCTPWQVQHRTAWPPPSRAPPCPVCSRPRRHVCPLTVGHHGWLQTRHGPSQPSGTASQTCSAAADRRSFGAGVAASSAALPPCPISE